MTQLSFVRNQGSIHRTWRDGGNYGAYLNACRLDAWALAIDRHRLDVSRVIDVGCSSGSWGDNWRELGFRELIGIEPNPSCADQAREVFDRVHVGYAADTADLEERSAVVAANAVVVHILEEDEQRCFLADAARLLATGGRLLVSVLNCAYYVTPGGRDPWTGPNSCTRTLERHEQLAGEAGLRVVDRIGTFINPWCVEALDFVAGSDEIKADRRLYQGWRLIADALRPAGVVPFAEVLLVMSASTP